jgi:hypothetical protein
MKLSNIKLKDRNPRLITDEALNKLAESIKRDPEFMKLRPIVIDSDNVIIGGNQRYKAIQTLGMSEIPDSWVVKADNLTQEQRERFVIVDNAPSGMAGDWDFDILKHDWDLPKLIDLGFFENQLNNFTSMNFDDEIITESERNQSNNEYSEKFGVLIMCDSEEHQQKTFEELQDKNYQCKIVSI